MYLTVGMYVSTFCTFKLRRNIERPHAPTDCHSETPMPHLTAIPHLHRCREPRPPLTVPLAWSTTGVLPGSVGSPAAIDPGAGSDLGQSADFQQPPAI